MPPWTPEQRRAHCRRIASKGGHARAARLSAARRQEIARQGWEALVRRRFHGDRDAAKAWLIGRGRMRDLPPPDPLGATLTHLARAQGIEVPADATEDQYRQLWHRLVGAPPAEEEIPF